MSCSPKGIPRQQMAEGWGCQQLVRFGVEGSLSLGLSTEIKVVEWAE